MASLSPNIIQQTIELFERRTGQAISKEDARQAVENLSGFFQVLDEWDRAGNSIGSEEKAGGNKSDGGNSQ